MVIPEMIQDELFNHIKKMNTPDIIRLHEFINEEYIKRKNENKNFRQAKWQVLNPTKINAAVKKHKHKNNTNTSSSSIENSNVINNDVSTSINKNNTNDNNSHIIDNKQTCDLGDETDCSDTTFEFKRKLRK